jgi:hypothetical protein
MCWMCWKGSGFRPAGDWAAICPQVSLGDLFSVTARDPGERTAYRNKIDRKWFDVVLCEPETMRPVQGSSWMTPATSGPGARSAMRLWGRSLRPGASRFDSHLLPQPPPPNLRFVTASPPPIPLVGAHRDAPTPPACGAISIMNGES